MRIQRQSETFSYRMAYDPRKIVWTPEDRALAAELSERLKYKTETGEIPQHHPDSPEHYTQALQEMIQMREERANQDDYNSLDLGYDPAYSSWEHEEGNQKTARFWIQATAPQSLSFRPHPDYPGGRAAQAFDGDKEIGRLSWTPKDTVEWITTHPEYRGNGVAKQLFDWAKQNMVPNLQHSNSLTPDGEAFARSLGHQPPRDFNKQPPVDDSEDWPDAPTGRGEKWQGEKWNSDWYKRRLWEMDIERAHESVGRNQSLLDKVVNSGTGNLGYRQRELQQAQERLEGIKKDPEALAYLQHYLSNPE